MSAGSEAVMGAAALMDHGADQVPACPVIEPVSCADRVHVGGVAEQVCLNQAVGAAGEGPWIVDAQQCWIAWRLERMRVRTAEGPMITDELRYASERAISRTFIEVGDRTVPPHPLVDAAHLERAQWVREAVSGANFCGPLVVDAGHDRRAVEQLAAGKAESGRFVACAMDLVVELVGADHRERPVLVG